MSKCIRLGWRNFGSLPLLMISCSQWINLVAYMTDIQTSVFKPYRHNLHKCLIFFHWSFDPFVYLYQSASAVSLSVPEFPQITVFEPHYLWWELTVLRFIGWDCVRSVHRLEKTVLCSSEQPVSSLYFCLATRHINITVSSSQIIPIYC